MEKIRGSSISNVKRLKSKKEMKLKKSIGAGLSGFSVQLQSWILSSLETDIKYLMVTESSSRSE